MSLTELLRAVGDVAQRDAPAAQCETLARESERLADMVGWASGPIDPHGQLLGRLATLQADLTLRQGHTSEASLALLQNALTELGRAIARHDEQLDPSSASEDDGEDFI
jgi:hypothetical protein